VIVPEQNLLTPNEVAELVGCHVVTVREALRAKQLKGTQHRRRWYVRKDDAVAWAGPLMERVSA
jgi:excisionase family DNA binding protein